MTEYILASNIFSFDFIEEDYAMWWSTPSSVSIVIPKSHFPFEAIQMILWLQLLFSSVITKSGNCLFLDLTTLSKAESLGERISTISRCFLCVHTVSDYQ